MNKSFVISQSLYLTAAAIPLELQSLSPERCADGSIRCLLAQSDNETILEQYLIFKDLLDRIVGFFPEGAYAPVFSIAIKVYEYIPEISLPPELLQSLSRINSSIDIDLIDMRGE